MSAVALKGLSQITRGISQTPLLSDEEDLDEELLRERRVEQIEREIEQRAIETAKLSPEEREAQDKAFNDLREFDSVTIKKLREHQLEASPELTQRRPGRPRGKRSNPDYETMTVLVRKDTRQEIDIKLLQQREGPQDLSELVETLLRKHLSSNSAQPS